MFAQERSNASYFANDMVILIHYVLRSNNVAPGLPDTLGMFIYDGGIEGMLFASE